MISLKKLLISVMALFSFLLLTAEPVDIDKALTVASNWLSYQNDLRGRSTEIDFHSSYTHKIEDQIIFFVFNFKPEGFVIVAGDDASVPVLGYSTIGSSTLDEIPDNALFFFEVYEQSIIEINSQRLSNESTIGQWEAVLNNDMDVPHGARVVEPLLSSKWNQNYPWNQNCPQDNNGPGGHALVGCVAVAMAQVMRYWSHPEQGIGSHTYHHQSYGWLSADFEDALYNWQNMPDLTATPDTSELLFHAGVSVEMNYGAGFSSAPSSRARHALVQFFDYDNEAHLTYRVNYTTPEWTDMLKAQLDNSQPMYYQGFNQNHSVGHAFNCDGYDTGSMFHFNWGWGGGYDGYYHINALNPGNSNYNHQQAAIINLKPSEHQLEPPALLTAVPAGTHSVLLNWDDISDDLVIKWDNDININGIGSSGNPVVFKVAARFLPSHLADFDAVGKYLTKVRFVPREANCNYSINIWVGGSASNPGNMVIDQPVGSLMYYEWNTVDLDTPVYISGSQELWIGYHIDTQSGYPAGFDSGPAVDGFGNMIKWNNQWRTLLSFSGNLDYNWNLQGVVESQPGSPGLTGNRPETTYSLSFGNKISDYTDFLLGDQSPTGYRNPIGFNVYRNNDMINSDPVIDSHFMDENLSVGTYYYHVTAVYEDGESEPSNTAEITVTGEYQPVSPVVNASVLDGVLNLTWQAVLGADYYKVYSIDNPYCEESEWQVIDITAVTMYSEAIVTGSRFYRVIAFSEESNTLRKISPAGFIDTER